MANSDSTPTCKAAESTTGDSGHEVLLNELAALRRSEAVLRDFIETSTIGLHWVGVDGTILWVNQAELDLLGYSREEYVGRNIAEFHADESAINDILGRLSRGETLRDYSARLRHHDGSIRHVLINSSVLFEDGKFVHTRCFTRDVTSLRQEQDVHRLLAAIVDSSDDAIFSKNLDGTIESWNAGAEKLFGYPAEQIIGKPLSVLLPPDRLSEFPDILARIRAGGRLERYEVTLMRKDGRRVDVSVTISPISDSVGCLVGSSTIARDITDRRQADAALRRSEERFRFAQLAARIGTFDWDIKTGINTWTPELEAMYGLAPGGFPGTQMAWEALLHPNDRERVLQLVAASFETGTSLEGDWQVVWPDRSIHWITGRWQVFKDAAGEPLRMMGINIDISDRKRVEEALRQSEERFRLAIKATNDAIWDIDLETGVVGWNDTYSTLYGRSPETSNSWQWWIDRIHPDDRERTAGGLQKAISSETSSWTCEYRFRRVSGAWAHIYDRAYIARDSSGKAWRVIGAMQDLTDRKQAETRLHESEERLRRVSDNADVGLTRCSRDWYYLSANPAYARIAGKPLDQIVGRPIAEVMGAEAAEAIRPCVERVLLGEHVNYEAEVPFEGAGRRYLHVDYTPDTDGAGQVVGWVACVTDITEFKKAESALRESEERFRRVFEEGPLGVALVGRDNLFLEVNSALCQMVGYAEEELIHKTFADITHPDDVRADMELAEKLFKREIPFYRMQKRYVKKNGEIIWVNLTASLLRAHEGDSPQRLTMFEDITEIKRAQEEAIIRQKLESLGTLASGIAHDFNNLLGAVLAQAELAQAELATGSRPEGELHAIRDIAMRGSEIVRELMIYAGQESESLGLIDVSQIVQEMLELLKVSVSKHARIELDLGQHLPSTRATAAQISQLVMNLVTNASEAIGDRDGLIRVTTRRVIANDSAGMDGPSEGKYVQLEVSDTGSGILRETQARVFDPFFTTKSAGRGLGLAVVQGIVRSLGGTIGLVSNPDHGTTVQILLPCAETASEAVRESMSHISQPARPSNAATVLVVEDEDPLRQAVSKMLRKHGFSVIEVRDGSAALDAIRGPNNPIDVLLLDITLPGVSGREVLQEARRLRPEMRVVVTSAYPEGMAAASLQTTIEHFIRKPYRLDDFMRLL
jgi:two-component system cell cycle sensor histidine kinase/response regulator CckA